LTVTGPGVRIPLSPLYKMMKRFTGNSLSVFLFNKVQNGVQIGDVFYSR